MPLQKGKSKKAFSNNVAELIRAYRRKGKIGSSKPKSEGEARKQALAIAYSVRRGRKKK